MSISNDGFFNSGGFTTLVKIPSINGICGSCPSTIGSIIHDTVTNKIYFSDGSRWILIGGGDPPVIPTPPPIQYSLAVSFRSMAIDRNGYVPINGSGWFSSSGFGTNNNPVDPANSSLEYTWIAPHNGVMTNMIVGIDVLPDTDFTTFTVVQYRPGNPGMGAPSFSTELTVRFDTTGSKFASDNTHIVSFQTGDIFALRSTPNNTNTNSVSFAGTCSLVVTKT